MKEFLDIRNLTFAYPDAVAPLLDNVSLHCQPGWTGIVGPNGGGKTTLLKLISADLLPSQGTIHRPGPVHYAAQDMEDKPDGLSELILNFDKPIIRIRNQLQIQSDWLERWETLSFGERKRCQIGVALATQPTVLLLDEPSNHLDFSSKTILIETLQSFKGVGLIVSHDRLLLDTLCSHTLFIEPPKVDWRACSYSIAIQERERELAALVHERREVTRTVKKLKRRSQEQRQKAGAADKKRSKQGLHRKDHDAKARIDAGRLTGKDGIQGRLYQRVQRRLQRAEEQQRTMQVKKNYRLGITYIENTRSHKFPLTIPAARLALGDTFLLNPELTVAAGEKIGLIGDNGSGKSTFVNYLVTSLPLQTDEVIYIPQEIPTDSVDALLKRIHTVNDAEKGDMMIIIRRLGSEPARLLETTMPSPGEARKLLLAFGLQKKPALIIMDEPTNHMDLPSIECLEKALGECGCALLLVSHDYIFLQHLVSYFWNFQRHGRAYRISPSYSIPL
ncbi:ABC transporter ATP-binding protein [candidate division KSB1 bacterium]|nr:ABC-F family ATP-binding cassette domain-containing protein [candidate division KSB1 bacterium]RQW00150.1 MAG: ABC transporter ATP-binding protein [candidate division KSB1 bacterium]